MRVLVLLALVAVVSAMPSPWFDRANFVDIPKVAGTADPPRPNVTEVFEAEFLLRTVNHTAHTEAFGQGWWHVNQPRGFAADRAVFEFHHARHNYHNVQRWNTSDHTSYTVTYDTEHRPTCTKTQLHPPMAPVWQWVEHATYMGKRVIERRTYDLWVFLVEHLYLEVVVAENQPNIPIFFEQRFPDQTTALHYLRWFNRTPAPSNFDIPTEC
jgi:hypothetical protein